jgi:acetolactate synthase-1/2/3 large subunit
MGLGAYPATDKQFIGMLGMHGTYEANMAMHDCDTLIAIGARFDDRVTGKIDRFCPEARIVHVDIDPSSISKNVQVDIPIVGSVPNVLRAMINVIRDEKLKPDTEALAQWWRQIDEWRKMKSLSYRPSD